MVSIWKKKQQQQRLFLTHFLVTREKTDKFIQHISYLHNNIYLDFFALLILQKKKYIS